MSEFWKNKTGVSVVAVLFVYFLFSGLCSILTTIDVFADNTISLNVSSNSVVLGLAPKTSEGAFAKSSNLNISVSLTGVGGYTLGIRSGSMGANATNLVNTIDNTKLFTSISSAISESDFANAANTQYNNTWGYLPSKFNSENNTYFRPAPGENGDILDYTETDNASNSYTLAIGARANLDTAVGSYTGTFVITAVANLGCNSSATTIGDALCLQDFSGANSDSIINSMEEGRQYQLKDNRDWKTYYIAKMKDGRVYMTQNLDLDLETTPTNVAALTHDNTDLGWTVLDTSATWTPSVATATTAADWGTNTNTAPTSFDYGEVYRYVDTAGNTTSYSTKSACETAHTDGTCSHYHVGNYYNWTAAIASNDSSAITGQYITAPNSICPAGWRLPEGKTSTTSTDSGYYSEINYTWVSEGIALNYVTGASTVTGETDSWIKIRNAPMYMVAAGSKSGTSSVSSLGSYGYYWTGTNNSSSQAFMSYFYNSSLYPGMNNSRGTGRSVRCVARQANTGSTAITFNKNANDATGTMSGQIYNAGTLNTLPSNGFSRSGYQFGSWNTKTDGSGDSYSDVAQYYAKVGTATNNVTLYAQWDKVYTITFNLGANATGIYFDGVTYTNGQTVQAIEGKEYDIVGLFNTKYGINSWSATAGTFNNNTYPTAVYTVPSSNATITLTGKEATVNMTTLINPTDPVSSTCKNESIVPELVYDPRDNEAYYVARLCDGKYWMLDNLRLDLANVATLNNLSTNNTNATEKALSCLKTGFYNGDACASPYTLTAIANSNSMTTFTDARIKNDFKNDIPPVFYGAGSSKIGIYYNYCAVSAGSYCYNTTANMDIPDTDYDLEGDICPIGWHLPTGTNMGGGDFGIMGGAHGYNYVGDPYDFKGHFSVPFAGYYYSTTQYEFGQGGYFWTSTGYNSNFYRYNLHSSDESSAVDTVERSRGLSVRCVLGSNQ